MTHAHARTRTHVCTHAHARTYAHTHTHIFLFLFVNTRCFRITCFEGSLFEAAGSMGSTGSAQLTR